MGFAKQGGCQCYANTTWKESVILTPPPSWTLPLPHYPAVKQNDVSNQHCNPAALSVTTSSLSSPSTLLHTISSCHDTANKSNSLHSQQFNPTQSVIPVAAFNNNNNANNHSTATPFVYCFYSHSNGFPYEITPSSNPSTLTASLQDDYNQCAIEG